MTQGLPTPPTHKNEQTGNPALDRIQSNVRDLIAFVRSLAAAFTKAQPISLMLAADFTTTLATPQPTKLTFPVKAGECWDVAFYGLGACSSVNGMQYAFDAPPGSTISGVHETSSANTSAANWLLYTFAALGAIGAAHVGASNAGRPDKIVARIKAGADGAITLQACSVTAATTTTVSAKAYLFATRVTET